MDESSQLFQHRIPLPQEISHCQVEVRRCLELLMVLNETTSMETWSDDLKENYRQVADGLATIELCLHLLKEPDEGGDGVSSLP